MTCLVILEFNTKPDCIDKMKAWLKNNLPDSRGNAGCVSIDVTQDQDDPTAFLLVEQWESRAIYDIYLKWRVDRGDVEVLDALVSAPLRIRYFDYAKL